jgi:hypothetical protein
MNYTYILVGWIFSGFRLFRFLRSHLRLRNGGELDRRFGDSYRFDWIKLRGGR